MKKLVFLCVSILVLVACGEANPLVGRWAMESEQSDSPDNVVLAGDTVISPELRFDRDSVYMEVRSDGVIVKSEIMGIYAIKGDEIRVTDRYGKEQISRFFIKDGILTVVDKNNPDKVLMRLTRLRDE